MDITPMDTGVSELDHTGEPVNSLTIRNYPSIKKTTSKFKHLAKLNEYFN